MRRAGVDAVEQRTSGSGLALVHHHQHRQHPSEHRRSSCTTPSCIFNISYFTDHEHYDRRPAPMFSTPISSHRLIVCFALLLRTCVDKSGVLVVCRETKDNLRTSTTTCSSCIVSLIPTIEHPFRNLGTNFRVADQGLSTKHGEAQEWCWRREVEEESQERGRSWRSFSGDDHRGRGYWKDRSAVSAAGSWKGQLEP